MTLLSELKLLLILHCRNTATISLDVPFPTLSGHHIFPYLMFEVFMNVFELFFKLSASCATDCNTSAALTVAILGTGDGNSITVCGLNPNVDSCYIFQEYLTQISNRCKQ